MPDPSARSEARSRLRDHIAYLRGQIDTDPKNPPPALLVSDLELIVQHSDRSEADAMAAFRRGVIPASTGDAGIIFIPEQVFDRIIFDLNPKGPIPTIVRLESDVDPHSFVRGYNAAKVIDS